MASRGLLGFAIFSKFVERKRPDCLEQPPPAPRARFIRCYERFGDEVCDVVQNRRCSIAGFVHDGGRRLEGEAAGEDSQTA